MVEIVTLLSFSFKNRLLRTISDWKYRKKNDHYCLVACSQSAEICTEQKQIYPVLKSRCPTRDSLWEYTCHKCRGKWVFFRYEPGTRHSRATCFPRTNWISPKALSFSFQGFKSFSNRKSRKGNTIQLQKHENFLLHQSLTIIDGIP